MARPTRVRHDSAAVGGFVVDGAQPPDGGVASAEVVPGFDPLEDGQGQLAAGDDLQGAVNGSACRSGPESADGIASFGRSRWLSIGTGPSGSNAVNNGFAPPIRTAYKPRQTTDGGTPHLAESPCAVLCANSPQHGSSGRFYLLDTRTSPNTGGRGDADPYAAQAWNIVSPLSSDASTLAGEIPRHFLGREERPRFAPPSPSVRGLQSADRFPVVSRSDVEIY